MRRARHRSCASAIGTPARRTCQVRCRRRMLLSAVRDTAGELGRCRGPERATRSGPAQAQPQDARQAELIICDKAIERTLAWLGQARRLSRDFERLPARRLSRDFERLPETGEAMILAAMSRIMLRRLAA